MRSPSTPTVVKSRSRRSANRPVTAGSGASGDDGFDVLGDGRHVEDLDDARYGVDVESLSLGPVVRVVVGHDAQQRVPGVAEADYDAAPELVDADGADAVVAAAVELLQMNAGCSRNARTCRGVRGPSAGRRAGAWRSRRGTAWRRRASASAGSRSEGCRQLLGGPIARLCEQIQPSASPGASAPGGQDADLRAGHATSITVPPPTPSRTHDQVGVPVVGAPEAESRASSSKQSSRSASTNRQQCVIRRREAPAATGAGTRSGGGYHGVLGETRDNVAEVKPVGPLRLLDLVVSVE